MAAAISEMPTGDLVELALALDADGEIRAGEDNLVIVQMEITDRIKQNSKE